MHPAHRKSRRGGSVGGVIESLESRRLISGTPRQMEFLDRGVIAVNRSSSSAYISWRLLATDPSNIAFNLYRTAGGGTTKLNGSPITNTTDFTDSTVNETIANTYFVKPVINGVCVREITSTWPGRSG